MPKKICFMVMPYRTKVTGAKPPLRVGWNSPWYRLAEMRDVAQSGIEFAREKLSTEQRAYLARLPLTSSSESCQFVHAHR
jgi:hypothetical protein